MPASATQSGGAGLPAAHSAPPTLGAEEEFLLVDAETLVPVDAAERVLDVHHRLHPKGAVTVPQRELLSSMIETTSPVCAGLPELRAEVSAARERLVEAAGKAGCRVLAHGTAARQAPPRTPTEAPHYRDVAGLYRLLAQGTETCGCHIHVGVPDREAAVHALDHVRPWLPVLLALSANSPYEHGVDTGFASWRTMVLSRWPTTQIPPYFTDAADYDATHRRLFATGVLPERARNAYWLARPSAHVPTLEVRVADVMPTVREVAAQAGLTRALVVTALRERAAGRVPAPVPAHDVAAALWTAARYGLGGSLVHPENGTAVPAGEAVAALLAHIGEALADLGDEEEVTAVVRDLLHRGEPARRQRAAARGQAPGDVGEWGVVG
ncbi:glutamate--cysteine ligase [Streptomyces sp. AM 3-1-1]|uniref:carboxylate-amine ligase n=1 Tax=Streptomyces sp. AM 3-1-1 TaxID=3028711 RepID=UPI0023B9F7DE|nr:glutamate--cysteine ligase [Streptomyces sp. AM 3-1-1]WEH30977.1 glutamate--cysteine ligase [Streptomyces sp. AM 3-1-1]